MFTGIIQGVAEVVAIERRAGLHHLTVALPQGLERGLETGASVAHNGCCLTVTEVDGTRAGFDLMAETLRVTNLSGLEVGDRVNIERAARFGDEIGGHAMSGHIICQATLEEIIEAPNNRRLWFRLPGELLRFVFDKGYIGVDGASLTVAAVEGERFCVDLIPETLARTTLGERSIGARVNIEIDPQTQAIVTTVERVLAARTGETVASPPAVKPGRDLD
ncbi:riboflavin synthase [Halotalea alkalilenta]|uniref:riboflavin synthase n=1 Tax=Halotalea alkalilenta TaxID=376489 RepID=UPI0006934BCA|nr:riboflavin synthase [Halotalea alkalilenta]